MATLLEHGGKIELGGGWSTALPPSYFDQNPDGSWASWGADWALDIQIIEVAGDSDGHPASAEKMLGSDRTVNSSGAGWIGEVALLTEEDSGRAVYRLAATLAAKNTVCCARSLKSSFKGSHMAVDFSPNNSVNRTAASLRAPESGYAQR